MTCKNITCPLTRMESVAQRFESIMGTLVLASAVQGTTSTPESRSALDELWGGAATVLPTSAPLHHEQELTLGTTEAGELDALAQREQSQLDDYNKRLEAWNLREQAVQQERLEVLRQALDMRPEDLTEEQRNLLDALHASMSGLNIIQQERR